jgi:hypothetical protein
MSEEIIARIDYNHGQETELKQEASIVKVEAKAITVTTPEEYENAVAFGRKIVDKIKKIEEFFKPIKDAANKAHKAITSKENEALEPLRAAKATVQTALVKYQNEQERKRRAEQEEQRKRLQAELERSMRDAAGLEEEGNAEAAEMRLNEAVSLEGLAAVATVQSAIPKVQETAVKKDFIIAIVDEKNVPVEISGAVIRPVDLMAIKKLVKATNGNIRIPGVSIAETAAVSLRR